MLLAIGAAVLIGGLLATIVFWAEFLTLGPVARLHERLFGPKDVQISSPFGLVHRVCRYLLEDRPTADTSSIRSRTRILTFFGMI